METHQPDATSGCRVCACIRELEGSLNWFPFYNASQEYRVPVVHIDLSNKNEFHNTKYLKCQCKNSTVMT